MIAAHAIPPCPAINICAVARETARSGWPHPVTEAEAKAITSRVARAAVPKSAEDSRIVCYFRRTPATGYCAIRYLNYRGKRTAYRVTWRVWRDGRYALLGPV